MKPYYEEGGITIYNADCAYVLPNLTDIDVVIVDGFLDRGAVGKVNIGHPCSKPKRFSKLLISRFSKPDDLILDPFMGSSSFIWAAKELNRKAIGIEIERKYCDIAIKRLRQGVFKFD